MGKSTGDQGGAKGRSVRGTPQGSEYETTITIPSQGSKVALVRSRVGDLAKKWGFDDSEIFDIKVAVGEACANAIEHGSPMGKTNLVTVKLHVDQESLVIEVSDQGAFKPRFPTFDSRLNYRGRGLPFMLALMDDVEIQETEAGTTVRLVKLHRR